MRWPDIETSDLKCGLVPFAGWNRWIRTTPLSLDPATGAVPLEGGYKDAAFDRLGSDLAAYNFAADAVMTAAGVPSVDLHGFTLAMFGATPASGTYDAVHFVPEVRQAQASFLAGWISCHFASSNTTVAASHYTAPLACVALPTNGLLPKEELGSVIPPRCALILRRNYPHPLQLIH